MKKYLIIASMLATTPVLAAENSTYRCEHLGAERVIEISYPKGTAVPCEVSYTKAEGTEVLWRAANTEGYCEEKAAEFVEKQRNWGWQCALESAMESDMPEIVNPIS